MYGINQSGDAVGWAVIEPDILPFTYNSTIGEFTNVPSVAGDYTLIYGISNSGTIVGYVESVSSRSGLIIDKDGSATLINHPEDVFSITAFRGINSQGLITGFYYADTGQRIGFIYEPKTDTFTDFVPSIYTVPRGINEKGIVVGSALFIYPDQPYPCYGRIHDGYYGWVRKPDGNVTYFTVNGLQTVPTGITDSDTIIGIAQDYDSDEAEAKGFLVKVDELAGSECQEITIADEELLQFPDAIRTFPEDISNSGVISGFYMFDDTNSSRGFIAHPK